MTQAWDSLKAASLRPQGSVFGSSIKRFSSSKLELSKSSSRGASLKRRRTRVQCFVFLPGQLPGLEPVLNSPAMVVQDSRDHSFSHQVELQDLLKAPSPSTAFSQETSHVPILESDKSTDLNVHLDVLRSAYASVQGVASVQRAPSVQEVPSVQGGPLVERVPFSEVSLMPVSVSALDSGEKTSSPAVGAARLVMTNDGFGQDWSTWHSPRGLEAIPQLSDVSSSSPSAALELPAGPSPILDGAKVLTPARLEKLTADINELESTTGWRLRILTRYSPAQFNTNEIRAYWKPDARTAVVILDVTSPNIFNFNSTGFEVLQKLPRRFFIELQSRYGNQFYVAQEGDQSALLETANVLITCLSSNEGCTRVPGLSDDLFVLTLSTSIAGGAVFGFALRQEPTGQVTATWQWVLLFSPLWFILFVALGLQPVASRTSEVLPILKDTLAFSLAAAAVYLTPILGQSPAAKWFSQKDDPEQ